MKNHYQYILIILLVILQSLHGYAYHNLKKMNVNAVTSDKIIHQRYASFIELNLILSIVLRNILKNEEYLSLI